MSYKIIHNPKEGELLQYIGVYVTKWQPSWGELTVGFVENDYTYVDALRDLEDVMLVDNTTEEAQHEARAIAAIFRKLAGTES